MNLNPLSLFRTQPNTVNIYHIYKNEHCGYVVNHANTLPRQMRNHHFTINNLNNNNNGGGNDGSSGGGSGGGNTGNRPGGSRGSGGSSSSSGSGTTTYQYSCGGSQYGILNALPCDPKYLQSNTPNKPIVCNNINGQMRCNNVCNSNGHKSMDLNNCNMNSIQQIYYMNNGNEMPIMSSDLMDKRRCSSTDTIDTCCSLMDGTSTNNIMDHKMHMNNVNTLNKSMSCELLNSNNQSSKIASSISLPSLTSSHMIEYNLQNYKKTQNALNDKKNTKLIKPKQHKTCNNKSNHLMNDITKLENIINNNNMNGITHNSTKNENDRKYKCKHCYKTFEYGSQLDDHSKVHSNKKPFKCDTCNRTYKHKSNLKTHKKTHSPTFKPFICKFCSKKFISSSNRNRHIKKSHK